MSLNVFIHLNRTMLSVFLLSSTGQRPSDFNSMDTMTMGDNEHSNMDSDDLVPSLQVSNTLCLVIALHPSQQFFSHV